MNTKNDVEVIINGRQYTLSGYESSEYLQKIASHINDKFAEFKQSEGYARLDSDMKNILLAINLSDDFYKAQQSVEELQKEKANLEKEIFNMKHDMIAMKTQIEDYEKEIAELKKDKTESEHQVIRLETELEVKASEESKAVSKEEEASEETQKTENDENVIVLSDDKQEEESASGETEEAVQQEVNAVSQNNYGRGKRRSGKKKR
jgi:cell division protein ZapA